MVEELVTNFPFLDVSTNIYTDGSKTSEDTG